MDTKDIKNYASRKYFQDQRSRSTPHIRISSTTLNTFKTEKTGSFVSEMSSQAEERYQKYIKKFDNLAELRMPSMSERHRNFIFERRAREPMIFSEKRRVTYHPVPIIKGESSVVLTKQIKGDEYLKKDIKANASKRSKAILKWNTFQWFLENKKEILNVLWKNYSTLIKMIKKKGKSILRSEFTEIMMKECLNRDRVVVEKLFWVLDNDSDGAIEHRELIIGLEFFRDKSFEDKIKMFFEICDGDSSGALTRDEVYEVLQKNVATKADKERIKRIVDLLFAQADPNKDGEVDRSELLKVASTNKELRVVLDESIKMIRKIDRYVNSNFQEAFQDWLPGAFLIKAKEGVHAATGQKFVEMFKETEQIWQYSRDLKKKLGNEYRKIKMAQGIDINTEADEYGV